MFFWREPPWIISLFWLCCVTLGEDNCLLSGKLVSNITDFFTPRWYFFGRGFFLLTVSSFDLHSWSHAKDFSQGCSIPELHCAVLSTYTIYEHVHPCHSLFWLNLHRCTKIFTIVFANTGGQFQKKLTAHVR